MIKIVRDYTFMFIRGTSLVERKGDNEYDELLMIRMKSVEEWRDDMSECMRKSFDNDKERARAACRDRDLKLYATGDHNFLRQPRVGDYAVHAMTRGHPPITRIECADNHLVPKETE